MQLSVSLLVAVLLIRDTIAGIGSLDNLPTLIDDLNNNDDIVLVEGQACLGQNEFHVYSDHCNYENLVAAIENALPLECPHTSGARELELLLGEESSSDVTAKVTDICSDAWQDVTEYPWDDVTGYGALWDKEYYDGRTNWNEAYESITDAIDYDKPGNVLKIDAARVRSLYDGEAKYAPIETPEHLENFENCELRSIMCCWPSDRQADDNNGNCQRPYDEKCVNAKPNDNTDLCAVDMTRAGDSNHINGGFATFEGDSNNNNDNNAEGRVHCHGFAWGTDELEADGRYRGNNLFYVSMYDHMYQRGYVRNIPGAPMCGCVEKMPIVSRADCTEIAADERWVFTWDTTTQGFRSKLEKATLKFNSCQGNGSPANNDLESFYRRLKDEGRATEEEFSKFKQTVVGNHQCNNAIAKTIIDGGYIYEPSPLTGDMDEWTLISDEQQEPMWRTVAVSGDGTSVYGITFESELFQYDPLSKSLTNIANGFQFNQISSNDNGSILIGVTTDKKVMLKENGGAWTVFGDKLMKQVDVSFDGNHIWAIDLETNTFYLPGTATSDWSEVDGHFQQLSVNHDGTVIWATNVHDQAYYRMGLDSKWKRVSGSLKEVSTFEDGNTVGNTWGIQNDGDVFHRAGTGGNWIGLAGRLKMMSSNQVGDALYGVDKFGYMWYRAGLIGKNGFNYAVLGTATQSSKNHGGKAERAIDGNTSGYWGHGSTTHSKYSQAWWKVELNKSIIINKIVIWNRTDCCQWRLSYSTVDILDDDGTVVATVTLPDTNDKNNAAYAFEFDNVEGSAVRVTLPKKESLSLAEVQVFGVEKAEDS